MKSDLSVFRRFPAPLRLVVFALILLLLWLPIAVPVYWLIPDQNLAGILALLGLYAEFIVLVRRWGREVHRQPRIFWSYGLEFSRTIGLEVLAGLWVGLLSVAVLISLETACGWITWSTVSLPLLRVILEGLLVSLALGFAEELLFRGWMLDELQRDYAPMVALWANAVLFATLHLRLLTFPALVLLGVALVWAKRSCSELRLGKRRDRLGLSIGLHAGLVWGNYILEVGKLITYTGRVPAWVTGIDRNPVAGLMGILLLGTLAFGMWQFANRRHPTMKW